MPPSALRVLVCLSLAGLAACATSPRGWTRAGTPPEQVERDRVQCEYEAKAATASYRSTPSPQDRKETAGMGAAVGDGIVIAEKQIELTNACMNARGYARR